MKKTESPDSSPESETAASSARVNRRTKQFHFLFGDLPEVVQELARKTFQLFLKNPDHKSLRRHRLKDTKKGQHESGSISVSIGMQYRAIYVEHGNTNLWYWIGTHAKYNQFTGKN